MGPTQTQTRLLFLTVNPQEKDKRKLELQNAEALSHAARKGHQNRKQKAGQVPSTKPARPRNPQLLCDKDRNPASLLYLLQPLSPDDRDEAEARWELTHRLQKQGQSPNNPLDATFRDPFDVFSVKSPPKYVFELIEFAIRSVWPRSCPETVNGATVIVKSYVSVIMESPTALHAAVSVQLGRIPLFNTTPENRRMATLERMKHQNQAFDLINNEIRQLESTPNRIPSEGILNAVGLLSLYGSISSITILMDDHPMSPLATAQSLNIYGRMELVEEHIGGMQLLVRRKGGVDCLKEISNRDLAKSVDLVWASRTNRRPGFTWTHPVEVRALFDNDPLRDFDTAGNSLYRQMGSGLIKIPGITAQQLQAIDCAAKVTIALDQHLRDPDMELGWGTIVQGRNSAHHELLNMPSAIEETDEDDDALHSAELLNYEICRIVCRIYGNIVLFPMPPPTAVKLHLSKDLLSPLLLLDPFGPEISNQERAFVAWAVTLGGITAFSTPYRKAYVRLIYLHFVLGNKPAMEKSACPWRCDWGSQCRQFLWWDHLLFDAGSRLWREAVDYGDEYLSEQLVKSTDIAPLLKD